MSGMSGNNRGEVRRSKLERRETRVRIWLRKTLKVRRTYSDKQPICEDGWKRKSERYAKFGDDGKIPSPYDQVRKENPEKHEEID